MGVFEICATLYVLASGEIVPEGLDDRRELIPRGLLHRELTPTGGGDAVEASAAAGLGDAPFPTHEATLLEPHEGGVERPHVELKGAARGLLESRGNRVPMERAERGDRLQHHQIERALQHVGPWSLSIRHANGM